MKFEVGDRIKCINPGNNGLVKGRVYTIYYIDPTIYGPQGVMIKTNETSPYVFVRRFIKVNHHNTKLGKILYK